MNDLKRITDEEEKTLARVLSQLDSAEQAQRSSGSTYDADLISLRDQIKEARLEDIPPLLEEMERLQQVSTRRAQVQAALVDRNAPYFGRMVLEENDRKREVLIGKGTYLDSRLGLRIVDWRDAPVSRLFYRYSEDDDYDEVFGDKEVEGRVLVRRGVTIRDRVLTQIQAPQGLYLKQGDGEWIEGRRSRQELKGGQGAAMRAEGHHQPATSKGKLGTATSLDGREERYLPEITALIDPRQFELLTKPDSHLVVIQGGAGSGKTTIGLHRMAYLAYQDPKRFRPDRMLVVVFNDALARYISRVLPALGVGGVPVVTYETWAHKLRIGQVRHLPVAYSDDAPSVVTRFKKHPRMLALIDAAVADLRSKLDSLLQREAEVSGMREEITRVWQSSAVSGVSVHAIESKFGGYSQVGVRHAMQRFVTEARALMKDLPGLWADLLTDGQRINRIFVGADFSPQEMRSLFSWCRQRCHQVLEARHARIDRIENAREEREDASEERTRQRDEDADDRREVGIDGADVDEPIGLDREDNTLLLLLAQKIYGGLKHGKDVLASGNGYEHVFVDEAQDLSPTELALVISTLGRRESLTLAGDTAQRLLMDNGFSDWKDVLGLLALKHVEIEPLKLGYRSTKPIVEFAESVLGPLRHQDAPVPVHDGVPVEFFTYQHMGEAVAALGEALRELMHAEPNATVAVIARYPEQADAYYDGLVRAEVARVRRVAQQDFAFRAGIDVTDIRQVKGLEFDYVVLVEVNEGTYPLDDESRHLLHIGATRAAHQLWVMSTGPSSPLSLSASTHVQLR